MFPTEQLWYITTAPYDQLGEQNTKWNRDHKWNQMFSTNFNLPVIWIASYFPNSPMLFDEYCLKFPSVKWNSEQYIWILILIYNILDSTDI